MDDRPTAATPLGVYLPRWLARRSLRIAPASAASYGHQVKKWAPLFDVPLGALTLDAIQDVLDELEAEGYAPRSVRAAAIVLATALADAVRNRIIDHSPMRGFQTPRVDPLSRRRALSGAEAAAFARAALAVVPGGASWRHWAGPPLALMLDVPLRVGEWRGLLWADVELYDVDAGDAGALAGVIRVRAQIPASNCGAIRTPLKSPAAVRDLPVTAAAAAILRRHRDMARTMALRLGSRVWHDHGLVFPGKRGGSLPINTVRTTAARIAREAGLASVPTMHVLRHTYVSRAVTAGIDPRILAKLLGHESPKTAYEAYLDLTEDAHRAVARAMAPPTWGG